MFKKIFFILFLFGTIEASAYYRFDSKIEQAYKLIISLHFDEAEKILRQEKLENPGNDIHLLYLNYIDFLKAFISESPEDFETLKKNSSARIDKLEMNKENVSSPFHFYIQAEILLQQALVRVKFNEHVASALELRRAFKLIEKNKNLYPEFPLNKKISGLLEAIVGSVPARYQQLVKIAGMNGSISHGVEELNRLYAGIDKSLYSAYKIEILFYTGFIHSVLSPNEKVSGLMNDMKIHSASNKLIAYVYSNVMMKRGENAEARKALDTALSDKSTYPFVFLYYKRALTRLRKLDLDAKADLDYFIDNFKGKNNVKAAYHKLAWIDLLRNDTSGYKNNMKLCIVKGSAIIDEDRTALAEANSTHISNIHLLKSRLYFDGGYYKESLAQIAGKKITDFPYFGDQLEITYRLARIMQMTGVKDKAVIYYETTIRNGASAPYHYAANSALQLGLMYEADRQYSKAKVQFEKAMDFKYDQYKNSIDQKAKAGLDRLKKMK